MEGDGTHQDDYAEWSVVNAGTVCFLHRERDFGNYKLSHLIRVQKESVFLPFSAQPMADGRSAPVP